jgi:hypothetical protein
MRGRVSAVNALFIGTSNQLGEFESGLTAAWLGVVASVVAGGIGTLAIVVLWMRLFPALARVERLDSSLVTNEIVAAIRPLPQAAAHRRDRA